MDQKFCPFCGGALSGGYVFCPHCGKQLQDVSVPLGKQLSVYALSVFLPPFGLMPGIKYLLSKNPQVKRVGVITIVLTIVATLVTFWLVSATVSQVNSSINSQLQQMQNYGY